MLIKSPGISDNHFPGNIHWNIRRHSFPDKQHRYGSINYLCQLEYQTTQTLIKQFSLAPAFWKFLGCLESVLHLCVFQISVKTARNQGGRNFPVWLWHSLAWFTGCTNLLCSVFQDSHTCALSWPTKSAAVSVNPCQRCTVADHMQDISRSPAMSRQHIAVPCSLWHLTNPQPPSSPSTSSSSSSSSVTSCCSTHPLCQLWSIHGAFILTAAVNLPNLDTDRLDNILLLAVSFRNPFVWKNSTHHFHISLEVLWSQYFRICQIQSRRQMQDRTMSGVHEDRSTADTSNLLFLANSNNTFSTYHPPYLMPTSTLWAVCSVHRIWCVLCKKNCSSCTIWFVH